MRWAGLILSTVVLATTLWFAIAAPTRAGHQLELSVEAPIA